MSTGGIVTGSVARMIQREETGAETYARSAERSLMSARNVSETLGDSCQSVAPWTLYSAWHRWVFLGLLLAVTTCSFFDYFVLSVLLEPIKREFRVSDTLLGLLSGFGFALLYALFAFPIARWSDRGDRRTVMTVALTLWSVMTSLCGMTRTYGQLALTRLGVGAVEPGAVPPAQSLIADYFPPEQRATALAILNQGGSAGGWLVGVVWGGYLASAYGWRTTFILAGLPGIVLAVLVYMVLAEPRKRLGFPRARLRAESLSDTVCALRSKSSFLFVLLGISVYCIFAFGVAVFLPSFMLRTLQATMIQVSTTWGLVISAANLLGAVVGGWWADRLSRRDVRWYGWFPALACVTGGIAYWMALRVSTFRSFLVVDFMAEAALAIGLPASFALVHSVCGDQRRTTAVATVETLIMVVGAGGGPLVAGMLSDVLFPFYKEESIRYALLTMIAFLVPAAAAFVWAARSMPHDLER